MPLFLYRLVVARPEMLSAGLSRDEQAILQRHEAYVGDLASRDAILLAGRTEAADDSTWAAFVLRAESVSEARRMVSADPAVAERLMRAELAPYRVTHACALGGVE